MNINYSPLRYPGGKAKLAPFFKKLFDSNNFCGVNYIEPYAGGAGVALSLLISGYSQRIYLNDISYPIFCFWDTVLHKTDYLCKRIASVSISPYTWARQKNVIKTSEEHSSEEIGFAFFFLNRTNRSGIMNGGMIGGKTQNGDWKLDARFNRKKLIKRIESIAEFRDRILIYNLDAKMFVNYVVNFLPEKSFVYLDPPYYIKGKRLYDNYYFHDDHKEISCLIQNNIHHPWVATYDYHKSIIDFYEEREKAKFKLNYSANKYRVGSEVMIFSDGLKIPHKYLKELVDG